MHATPRGSTNATTAPIATAAQLAEVEAKVRARVAPLEAACRAEVQRLEGLEAQRVQLGAELEGLQEKAASLE
jgi:hypothetical protein